MSSTSWTKRFGISDQELSDLKSASAGDPLRAALVNGRVPEHEYLSWAMQTYELPRLKSDFFQIPPDPILYEALKREFDWNVSFVPLAEWNGVLLVGCLEPPQFHFRTSYEARFVLASPKDLEARYAQLEPTKRTPMIAAIAPRAAFAPPPPPPPTAKPPPVAEAQKVFVPPPPPPPVRTAVAEAKPKVSLEELLKKPDIPLPEAPDISLDEPDGLVDVPTQASDARMVVPDGIAVGTVSIPKPPPTPVKEVVSEAPEGLSEKTYATQIGVDFGSLTAASAKFAPAPPRLGDEPTNAQAPVEAAPAVATTATIAPFPPTVPKPIPQPADFNTASTAPLGGSSIVKNDVSIVPLVQCTDYDDLAGAALGRVLKSYEVGMILLFQNGNLMPWKWTELLHSVKGEKPDPIDLTPASIFRIVFRTCLPYHGHVVPNPINTTFFNAFYRGVTPKHATIMPVLINKKVAGMIIGMTNGEVDFRRTLGEMEILAAEFGTHLDRVKSQKKAA